MEDGGAVGDNHSDGHSDKLGNGIVHAMKTKKGESEWDSLFFLFMYKSQCESRLLTPVPAQ